MSQYGNHLYGTTVYGGEEVEDLPLDVKDKRSDFQNLISEQGQEFALTKQDETTDGMGGVTGVDETNVFISGHLQPLSEKEREMISAGEIEKGNAKVYCKHEYIQDGKEYVIDTGDILKDGLGRKWRVETIEGRFTVLGFEIYRKVIVNRLDT